MLQHAVFAQSATLQTPLLAMFLAVFLATGSAPTVSAAENAAAKPLALATVRAATDALAYHADGVVEALRQSVIATQVAGAIVALPVKVGDSVKAGQLLLRLDARAANQEASASRAQVDAGRTVLVAASKDYERHKQLFAKQYISQAQLDRAEAQFQTARAQANSQIAQAGAVQTQTGFYVINAPYGAIVAEVPVTLGEMAMPGRPLMTVYDPAALRVTATVPQAKVAAMLAGQPARIEFPGLPPTQRWISVSKITVLPLADASTHTVQLRLDLPSGAKGLTPGMFARVSLPLGPENGDSARLYVPAKAVFRRAELTAVYVLNAQGKPLLRQVKPGAILGEEQEILAGISRGEQVALDPLAAAKLSASNSSNAGK